MPCDCCGVGSQFDDRVARKDLRRYQRRGPDAPTKLLLAGVDAFRFLPDPTLIDIGGGIGAIHHHLLERGFATATQVDASADYLQASASEAERRGHSGRVVFRHGDFRTVAPGLEPADLITLHRVVCCDPDYESLLGAVADRARRAIAFSYPRDRWYIRAGFALFNAARRLFRTPFRIYVHPPAAMAAVLVSHGLRRQSGTGTWLWEIELYARESP
jgi:magnesium-protoporphyrin O-methyltransferase